jgi:hypothetical protein
MQGVTKRAAGVRDIGVSLSCPNIRSVRRHARRHGQLTLSDHLAFWQAQNLARQCSREMRTIGWSLHLRIVLVLVFLAAGLTAGAVFA